MPATPFDSAIYAGVFSDPDVAKLFTDSAEVRAMLIVEGALARAQGGLGMIPTEAAEAIHRASMDVIVDPASLGGPTASNAVPVPALVEAFREAMADKDAAQYVHWGATTQDIMDTGLALRLRRVIERQREALNAAIAALATLAAAHRDLPMAGRTWGMVATPTSFGAVVASWGMALIRARTRLDQIAPEVLAVSLSGAAGTLSAMGADGAEVRAGLAESLGLADPAQSTHAQRGPVVDYAGWMASTTGSLAKMAEDVLSLVRAGEARLSGGGSSSTMPQKQNPVAPSVMVALSRHCAALSGAMTSALPHRDQRDGTAWLVEWMALPQLCIAATRCMALAGQVAAALAPDPDAMAHGIDPEGLGLTYAEALSFHLARRMPRPEAQAAVKDLCVEARRNGVGLPVLVESRFPGSAADAVFDPVAQLGEAPAEADRFVAAAG